MRGVSSSDGKISGNRQLVHAYDKDHGVSRGQGRPSEHGGESGGEHDPEGHDEIKQVVAEHGPAHTHKIIKNPHGDGYGSETLHEDGHKHTTAPDHHPDLGHAHEHGEHAMGEGDETDNMPLGREARQGARRREAAERSSPTTFMSEDGE